MTRRKAAPASEMLDPALFANLTGRGRQRSENAKKLITLRLPPNGIEGYRATGSGWQARMGEVLAAGVVDRAEDSGVDAA